MNPFTHLVIASKLERLVKPQDLREYYWGAVAPDIRYLEGMQRSQTHIPASDIIESISLYPHLRSFLQGYLIHCLCDEIELTRIFYDNFPFYLFRKKLSCKKLAVILELYCFESKSMNIKISNSCNEFLKDLNLKKSATNKFSQSIENYIKNKPDMSRISELLHLLGLEENANIKKYTAAADLFQKNYLLKSALFFFIKAGGIDKRIISDTAEMYIKQQIQI